MTMYILSSKTFISMTCVGLVFSAIIGSAAPSFGCDHTWVSAVGGKEEEDNNPVTGSVQSLGIKTKGELTVEDYEKLLTQIQLSEESSNINWKPVVQYYFDYATDSQEIIQKKYLLTILAQDLPKYDVKKHTRIFLPASLSSAGVPEDCAPEISELVGFINGLKDESVPTFDRLKDSIKSAQHVINNWQESGQLIDAKYDLEEALKSSKNPRPEDLAMAQSLLDNMNNVLAIL